MNEKLQLIREKCIEANLDIAALGFGCRVKILVDKIGDDPVSVWHDSVVISDYSVSTWTDHTPRVKVRAVEGLMSGDDPHLKILGRPIRLADVLLVYSITHFPTAEKAMFKELGEAMLEEYWTAVKDIIRRWNLRADDLEQQSEETINFLYCLLHQ